MMQKNKIQSLMMGLCMLGSGLTFAGLAQADDAALNKAEALIKAQQFNAAYELLEPLEGEQSGNINFDYLLGVAGVESGHVTRGVFALERVLATKPDHASARFEMAKAHLKLGEMESSKSEFQNLIDQKPSDVAKEAINRYMSAIDKALGNATTFNAYLDFGLGYDSNVNSGTAASQIAAPGISNTLGTLNAAAKETSDGFGSLAGGISFRQPISKSLAVFSGINYSGKVTQESHDFNTNTLDFNGGLQLKRDINTFTAAIQAGSFDVAGHQFRKTHGGTLQWQRDIDNANQVSAYAQYARLTYVGNAFRDADRYVVGAGVAHLFPGDKSPVVFGSIYGGGEDARANNADYLGNKLYGIRAGGQYSFNTKVVGFASAGYEYRDYDAQDPAFLQTRSDHQYDATLGLRYLPGFNNTITPQVSYINNDSNIVLNDFDRIVVSVNFRHDFNW